MNFANLKAMLDEQGFRPQDAEGSAIRFKFEGGTYYIDGDEKDNGYVRLTYPNFWELGAGESRLKALEVANKVTECTKAVKVFIIGNGVYCSVEQFLPSEDTMMAVLPRCLSQLQGAAKLFGVKLVEKDA